jgi:hypothetical protein
VLVVAVAIVLPVIDSGSEAIGDAVGDSEETID